MMKLTRGGDILFSPGPYDFAVSSERHALDVLSARLKKYQPTLAEYDWACRSTSVSKLVELGARADAERSELAAAARRYADATDITDALGTALFS